MTNRTSSFIRREATIVALAKVPHIAMLGPMGDQFVHALRLIALHQRAQCDPIPELTIMLGSVETAAKALALSETIARCWPETVQVSRFCCQLLTHDEVTIGTLVDAAATRDPTRFERSIEGLTRPDRFHAIWEAVLALLAAQARAHPKKS